MLNRFDMVCKPQTLKTSRYLSDQKVMFRRLLLIIAISLQGSTGADASKANETVLVKSKKSTHENMLFEANRISENGLDAIFIRRLQLKEIFGLEPRWLNSSPSYTLTMGDSYDVRFNGVVANARGIKYIEDPLKDFFNSVKEPIKAAFDPALIPVTQDGALNFLRNGTLMPDFVRAQKLRTLFGYISGPVAPKGSYAALRRVLRIMTPRNVGSSYSIIPLWIKSGQDRDFVAGAARGVTKVVNRLQSVDLGKPVVGNIHDDLLAGFLEIYSDPKVAQEKTLDLLGLYGTRGPNTVGFYGQIRAYENKIFGHIPPDTSAVTLGKLVSLLGSVGPALDARAVDQGFLYTMPSVVKGAVDYARSYHFWLPAYLANRLRSEGFSEQAAFQAVNRIGVLYEAFAEVGTTKGRYEFATLDESKKDVAFNAAGALWGASEDKNRLEIDIEALYDGHLTSKVDQIFANKKVSETVAKSLSKSGVKVSQEGLPAWINYVRPFSIENEAWSQAGFSMSRRFVPAPIKPALQRIKSSLAPNTVESPNCIMRFLKAIF